MNVIANNLRKARIDAGISQRDAARLTGINLSTIAKWECGLKGVGNPKIEILWNLCKIYKCSMDTICLNLDQSKDNSGTSDS